MKRQLIVALDRTGRLQTTWWNDIGPKYKTTANWRNRTNEVTTAERVSERKVCAQIWVRRLDKASAKIRTMER